jgi:cyanophycin synthetase
VDEYVLHDLKDRRGRAENEVPQLLMRGLPANTPCQIAPSAREGILLAFRRMEAGDRLVVIADEVDEALDVVRALANVREEEHCAPLAPAMS